MQYAGISFQSAVAHELFSDEANLALDSAREGVFQSAVAHELFSDKFKSS